MQLSVPVHIEREGDWYVISNDEYGVATQGRTVKQAILNFYDAFMTCCEDRDWRQIHGLPIDLPIEQPPVQLEPSSLVICRGQNTNIGSAINPSLLQASQMLC